MSQQLVNNGQLGVDARGAINANFAELYGAIGLPIKVPNLSQNGQMPVPLNTFVFYIFVQWVFGDPVLQIGTSGGGVEILPATPIPFDAADNPIPIAVTKIFTDPATLFFTLNGGSVNLSVIMIKGIF